MQMVIDATGRVRCLYGEAIDLAALGELTIRRASHVEPDGEGRWWADLSPVQGPRLGPFALRSHALEAERRWLEAHRLGAEVAPDPRDPLAVPAAGGPAGGAGLLRIAKGT
jgi:hypothetical protein